MGGAREEEGARVGKTEAIFWRSAADSSAALGSCHNPLPQCFSTTFLFLLHPSVLDVQIRSGAPTQ